MKTQEAFNEYMLYAQAQNDYYNSLIWVLFTLFVIAPIGMAIILFAVNYHVNRRNAKQK